MFERLNVLCKEIRYLWSQRKMLPHSHFFYIWVQMAQLVQATHKCISKFQHDIDKGEKERRSILQ